MIFSNILPCLSKVALKVTPDFSIFSTLEPKAFSISDSVSITDSGTKDSMIAEVITTDCTAVGSLPAL